MPSLIPSPPKTAVTSSADQSTSAVSTSGLQERRVAREQVAVAGPEQVERVLDLRNVRADRLEDRDVDDGHRDVHPGRPRAEREGVDDEHRLAAELVVERDLHRLLHLLQLVRAREPSSTACRSSPRTRRRRRRSGGIAPPRQRSSIENRAT